VAPDKELVEYRMCDHVKELKRHFTEGKVREAGLWIIGGKRFISSLNNV